MKPTHARSCRRHTHGEGGCFKPRGRRGLGLRECGALPRVCWIHGGGAGCGYRRSSAFGGGGDEAERQPIARGASAGQEAEGTTGGWKQTKRRRRRKCVRAAVSPLRLHLSISVAAADPRRDGDQQPACARGPDSIAPRNSSAARSRVFKGLVRGGAGTRAAHDVARFDEIKKN